MASSAIYKLKKEFITKEESAQIVNWVETLSHEEAVANHHLRELSKRLNGKSYMFDISNTHLTNYITGFQAIFKTSSAPLPSLINSLVDRISNEFGFSTDHVFLQAVDMDMGGKIDPHYDAAVEGYINYKCNLSVLSEDYDFFIDSGSVRVQETDLYGFEASLYKHWTKEFSKRRILLSFGFMIPYSQAGRSDSDPRVRLSRRIEKYFQRNT